MTTYTLSSPNDKSRIVFNCRFRTPGTEVFTRRIIEAFPNAGAVELLYAYIISNTREIAFEYDETAQRSEVMLSAEYFWVWLKEYFFKLDESGAIVGITDNPELIRQSFELFNEKVFDMLQEHWAMAYKNAQVLFPASQLVQPDESLSKEVGKSPDFLSARKST